MDIWKPIIALPQGCKCWQVSYETSLQSCILCAPWDEKPVSSGNRVEIMGLDAHAVSVKSSETGRFPRALLSSGLSIIVTTNSKCYDSMVLRHGAKWTWGDRFTLKRHSEKFLSTSDCWVFMRACKESRSHIIRQMWNGEHENLSGMPHVSSGPRIEGWLIYRASNTSVLAPL